LNTIYKLHIHYKQHKYKQLEYYTYTINNININNLNTIYNILKTFKNNLTLDTWVFSPTYRIDTTLKMVSCIDGMGDELFSQKLFKHFGNGTHIEENHFNKITLDQERIL